MASLCKVVACSGLAWAGLAAGAQMITPNTPPPERGSMALDVTPVPLLSMDNLRFLQGTWAADVGKGATPVGSYSWTPELNGHVLARRSADAACTESDRKVCAHQDLLYAYQTSAGAPLKAIYFDVEGHTIQYDITIRNEAVAGGRQDYAVFLSDPSALGPRYRLTYERNTDTRTDKTELTGSFEVLLANGKWHTYLQWGGRLLARPADPLPVVPSAPK